MLKDNILILKNGVVMYGQLIFTSIIGLIGSRLVIQNLGASDYGLYCVVGGIVMMLAFLNTVMVSTTLRFITFELGKNENGNLRQVFNISLVIHLGIAFLVLILTEIAGVWFIKNYLNIVQAKIPDALFVLRFSALATSLSVISIPYQGLLIAHEKFGVRAVIESVRSLLAFLAALIIIFFGNKLRSYSILIAIANGTPSVLFYLYCNKKHKSIIKWEYQRDILKYKEMLGFCVWIMIGAAAAVGRTQGSALIINAFFGTILNASFGIAKQVNRLILLFSRNIGRMAIPQITKSFSSGNKDRAIFLSCYVSKYTLFLMLLPSLPILLETDFLLTAWLGTVPPYTVIFCQLMIVDALIDGLNAGIPSIVQATGKIKHFQIIVSTTSLISLPIAYILFRYEWPPYAIQISFIITGLINVYLRQIIIKKLIDFDMKFFLKMAYLRVSYVVVLSLPLFLIRDFFEPSVKRFFIFTFFSIAWLLAVIYAFGIEKKEKKYVNEIIRKILLKMPIFGWAIKKRLSI